MIRKITENYQGVFVMVFLIIVMGIISYQSLPRESAPEIRRPLIFITTVYAGVSAGDIETLITKQIEDELEGLTGLDKLTSTSSQGVSQITAEFTGDTDVETALRRVKERVDIAKNEIPLDAEEPVVKELNFSDQPVLIINIANAAGLERLEAAVDYFEEEIKAIPGVLDVTVSGKLEKEVAIEVDPARLRHYGLSLDDVVNGVRDENTTIPGGILDNVVQQYSLAVSGEIKDPARFQELVVHADGKSVKLRNLGTASFTYKDPTTYNRMDQVPAVSLAITKRSGENLLRLVDDIKKFVEDNRTRLPHGSVLHYSFDQSEEVDSMVKDLENNIFSGLILVLVVTLFFLGPVNATFVSLGIPFSMLISFFVLQMVGFTLNVVVLFSLVLALGMLVDNGIVIVENIYRHRSLGASRMEAAIAGTSEVALPITTSTLTTILAFLPIIFMPGIMGEFMQFLPKTVIIVLTASLFAALTITTVFCSRFLSVSEKRRQAMVEGKGLFLKFQNMYVKTLRIVLRRPIMVLSLSFVSVFLGIYLNSVFGREVEFFPALDPKVAKATITLPAGTPLEITDRFIQQMEAEIPSVPASLETVQATSGSGGDRGRLQTNKAEIRIGFLPYLDRQISGKTAIQNLKDHFASFAGAEIKIQEQQDGPPAGNDLSFEVRGEDYLVMGKIADQIEAIIGRHRQHMRDIDSDFEAVKPEIKIDIDREKAALLGLNTKLVAQSIRTAINGTKVTTFRQGKEEYDVNVRFRRAARNQLDHLKDLEIVRDGKRIALSQIATISHQSSVDVIKRKNRRRAVTVFADFKPDFEQKQEITAEIEALALAIAVPKGYSVGKGEGQDVRSESTDFLVQAFLVALMLIFLALVLQFNSITQPIIILIAVFLSIGGVFWGLLIFQQKFVVIMSGIGTISLAGVVVNNAIVLIDFINQLLREGKTIEEAVIEGGRTRLRPVLLTAVTTVIGLLPMSFGASFDFHDMKMVWSSESSEWWGPMANAIIFGLSFATVFTLIIVPLLVYLDYRIGGSMSRLFKSSKRQLPQAEPFAVDGPQLSNEDATIAPVAVKELTVS